ncbi:O-antigen ligase family protein, partial [Shigella sonnei]|nr:O-antigen ligase family protein [Shigella sonnei]
MLIYLYPVLLLFNILPVFFYGQMNSDLERFFGVPIGYIPDLIFYFFVVLTSIITLRFHVSLWTKKLLFLGIIFLIYISIQMLLLSADISGVVILLSFFSNFIALVLLVSFCIGKDELYLTHSVRNINVVMCFGIICGVVKLFIGYSEDSNFIVYLNRNATAIIVVCFYCVYSYFYRGRKSWYVSSVLYSLFFLFLDSRAGIISFAISLFFVFLQLTKKEKLLISLFFVPLLTLGISFTDIGTRLERMLSSSQVIFSGGNTLTKSQNDYRRVELVFIGVDVLKENYLIGTGLGVANYVKAIDKKFLGSTNFGLAHNFYLSYSAQLGIIGFILLISVFYIMLSPIFKCGGYIGKGCVFALAFYVFFNEYILTPAIYIY